MEERIPLLCVGDLVELADELQESMGLSGAAPALPPACWGCPLRQLLHGKFKPPTADPDGSGDSGTGS